MLDDLELRTKTLIPLGMMALVILAMAAFGARNLLSVSETASDIIEHRDLAITRVIRTARQMGVTLDSVAGALIFDSNSAAGREAAENFPKAVAKVGTLFDEAIKLAPSKAASFARFKERFSVLAEQAKKPMQIGLDAPSLTLGDKLKPDDLNKMAIGAVLLGDLQGPMKSLLDDLTKFDDDFLLENAQAAADLQAQSNSALVMMGIVGTLSTLMAGAFSVWLSSTKIAGPLGRLAESMRALAQGKLTVEVYGQARRDEIGDMSKAVQVFRDNALHAVQLEKEASSSRAVNEAERIRTASERAAAAEEQAEVVRRLGDGLQAVATGDLTVHLDEGFSATYVQIRNDFNEAVAKLKETMLAVVSSTEAIRSGTQEIATASDDLSRRTEQQAASLEETAAALDEITATVKKSAEGASHARKVVSDADADAKQSATVVRQAVVAMDGIATSSSEISQIIGVIDEIAFQTNLLALNAGVEAARAGEAGRGFAVVASEVRALAQRSAEAAKQIKGLISSSSSQVDRGVKLVVETGDGLQRIVAQVSEINKIVGEIAAGTTEQAAGLQQINIAINQMDQTTQQNAAMVEQSSAASQSLSQETTQLAGLVGQFRVGQGSDTMQRELQKAAPQGRRQQSAPSIALVRKAAPSRKVANGMTGMVSNAGDWQEF
ncbi:methyl-accepting chemotaxis protein [Lichenifustis flavocetrariae]|uniref:Methyl-accepting chemotaxis protein n=1 Tax=Lichenifustis flavocetrariae TaxID=2949735 RepID=A0AA41Z4Q4_9HYPH|nr:HAMP domain-containing methyl-accepting chemotaxis protein [Lichenifustis flavocetrariae]MCW6512971.1 methyl-accepting chemotaxis protein [Lichenifustis flavocetrariae]